MPILKRELDACRESIFNSPATELSWLGAHARSSGVKEMIEFEEVTMYTEGGGARPFQAGTALIERGSINAWPPIASRLSPLASRGNHS